MALTIDAETITDTYVKSKRKLNKNVLQRLEADLDIDEKISIIFLITSDYARAFHEVCDLLNKYKATDANLISKYIDRNVEDWEDKLLEALCIIQNKQIIRRLGMPLNVLQLIFLPNHRLCSRHLNPIAKCLYILCEALTEKQAKLLLEYVESDSIEKKTNLENMDYLELHLLHWMEVKYISIYSDGRVDLKNLLKHLKKFDDIELIYEDLKKCDQLQNTLDNHNVRLLNMPQAGVFSSPDTSWTNCKDQDVKKIQKGLCIIISEMYFNGEYETRFGTTADCIALSETYKGFGFDVHIFENLKKHEMLEKLKSIPTEFGVNYDCIFVFILSHGCEGGVITTDEDTISLETIEHIICCVELQDVIKILVVQACQGKRAGYANAVSIKQKVMNLLTTDGRDEHDRNVTNIAPYRNFCIFMSTIQGFVSVRHRQEGSWFIQELCKTLRNEGSRITFSQAARKIIQYVDKKKGKLDGTDSIAQLPELRSYRLITDFQLPEYHEPAQ